MSTRQVILWYSVRAEHFQGFLHNGFLLLQDGSQIVALGEVVDYGAGIDLLLQLLTLNENLV